MFKIKFREDKNRKTHEEMMKEFELEKGREERRLRYERDMNILNAFLIFLMLILGSLFGYMLYRIYQYPGYLLLKITITFIFLWVLLILHLDVIPVRKHKSCDLCNHQKNKGDIRY